MEENPSMGALMFEEKIIKNFYRKVFTVEKAKQISEHLIFLLPLQPSHLDRGDTPTSCIGWGAFGNTDANNSIPGFVQHRMEAMFPNTTLILQLTLVLLKNFLSMCMSISQC